MNTQTIQIPIEVNTQSPINPLQIYTADTGAEGYYGYWGRQLAKLNAKAQQGTLSQRQQARLHIAYNNSMAQAQRLVRALLGSAGQKVQGHFGFVVFDGEPPIIFRPKDMRTSHLDSQCTVFTPRRRLLKEKAAPFVRRQAT
jgi:hypothetical protein